MEQWSHLCKFWGRFFLVFFCAAVNVYQLGTFLDSEMACTNSGHVIFTVTYYSD